MTNTIGNSNKPAQYITGQEPFLQILQSILNIDDSIQEARAKEIIKIFIAEVEKNKSYASSTLTCLKFLVNPKHSELIKKIVREEENMKSLKIICDAHKWKLSIKN